MSDPVVHFSDYASQPDVRIACDQSWTTPAWKRTRMVSANVYEADDGRFYTFDEGAITCVVCREQVESGVGEKSVQGGPGCAKCGANNLAVYASPITEQQWRLDATEKRITHIELVGWCQTCWAARLELSALRSSFERPGRWHNSPWRRAGKSYYACGRDGQIPPCVRPLCGRRDQKSSRSLSRRDV